MDMFGSEKVLCDTITMMRQNGINEMSLISLACRINHPLVKTMPAQAKVRFARDLVKNSWAPVTLVTRFRGGVLSGNIYLKH